MPTRCRAAAASAAGERADLTHQAEVVADRAVGRGLAVRDGDEVALTPGDRLARPRYAEELALVGAGHRPDADHGVVVLGQVLDLEARVREGGPQALHELGLALGTRRSAGNGRVVDVVLGEQVVEQR